MDKPPVTSSPGMPDAAEDDIGRFSINWKKEIVYILRAVMEKGEMVSAYFNRGENFILTAILDVDPDEEEVILDFGATEALNRKILDSEKIIFVTAHDKVKVQFVANGIEHIRFEGRDAFRIDLPGALIKLQRREYYRVTTPIINPLKCFIPLTVDRRIDVTIVDISIGGVGITLPPMDTEIEMGMRFQGCHLVLPEVGNITATLEVRNIYEVTLKNGQKARRAGCQFIDLPVGMQSMIQRYIIKVERDRRAMEVDRQ